MRIFGTIWNSEALDYTSSNQLELMRNIERNRKKATKSLMEKVFRDYYNLDKLRIEKNTFGKPMLQNSKLRFNISHSGKMVILAVDTIDIGIDVELIREVDINPSFISFDEKLYLDTFKGDIKNYEFFKIWVLKESFVKNLGLGLSLDFNKFSIDLNLFSIKFNNAVFNFKIYDFFPYVISVCTEKEEFPINIEWIKL